MFDFQCVLWWKMYTSRKRLTFARSVRSTKYRALFYCPKRSKQLPHILFCLLFAQHASEQLPVCSTDKPTQHLRQSNVLGKEQKGTCKNIRVHLVNHDHNVSKKKRSSFRVDKNGLSPSLASKIVSIFKESAQF